MLIFFYIINKKQIVVKKAWRDFTKANRDSGMTLMTNDLRLQVHEMPYEMTHNILMLKGPDAYEFNANEDGTKDFGNIYTAIECSLLTTYFFIHDELF